MCARIVTICVPEGKPDYLMASKLTLENPPTEVFRALSDPIRWSIIVQMSQVDELACITLEGTLPVSKPTISYHTKILQNAGLISTRKAGRNYYYSLRRDVIRDLLQGLLDLASMRGRWSAPRTGRYRRADVRSGKTRPALPPSRGSEM